MLQFVHDTAPVRAIFGNGAVTKVVEEVDRLGAKRAYVIGGGYEAVHADKVEQLLGERVALRTSEVVMHVPVEVATRHTEVVREQQIDVLVSVGGGSAVGLAKAIALATGLPIVAVPTTYAGSEMTPIWGLTENARKTTGRDLKVLPKSVVYDPELTTSLPAFISAASGMNALAHLVEGLYAPMSSPVTHVIAQEGIRALAASLPKVVADGNDLEARGEALYGAWLAGWTLGTAGMGIHHKVCHTLGGTYNLPHAEVHSAVIAYAAAYNAEYAPDAMKRIVDAFRQAGYEVESAPAAIWELADRIGAPTSLNSAGFKLADVDEAAGIVVAASPVNPRPVTLEGVRELLIAAHAGNKPVSNR